MPTDTGFASAFDRWKKFSEAARLEIPDSEIQVIAERLDRLSAAIRETLKPDLGFTEPAVSFRFPEGEP